MAIDPKTVTYQRSVLEFKSSSFTTPVLVLAENDIAIIETQLAIKIQQAPEFFRLSPIIIDFSKIVTKELEIDVAAVLELMRSVDLQPIGIRGGNDDINQQARTLKIALLSNERKHVATNSPKPAVVEKINQPEPEENQQFNQNSAETSTEIISQPVRSGQKIFASGDLVILAAVSAGAEIIAEGNIHIYGVLRGRALAGFRGDESCRIFCTDLQAELVSIAGNYTISEKISDADRGKPVQILLDNQKIIVNEL